jgi:hypothetical protein
MEPSTCNECGEEQSTHFCVECNVQLCKSCSGVIHSLKKRKDHHIMDVKEHLAKRSQQPQDTKEKSGNCQSHPNEAVIAYCITCEDPICLSCALGKHDGHTRKNLNDAQPEATKEFSQLLDESKSTNADLHTFQNSLTEENKKVKQSVEGYYKQLMEALGKEQEAALLKLNEFHVKNEKVIEHRIHDLDAFIDNMSKEKSFVEQLKIKKKVKYHLKGLVTEDSESVAVSDGYIFRGNEDVEELIKKSAALFTKDSELTLLQRINGTKTQEINEVQ